MTSSTFQQNLLNLQGNLYSFAYMLTSNRDDAYDLLQDTTLNALDSAGKYTEDTNFKGWVFTIMRNLFVNNYRKNVRSAAIVDTTDNLYLLNLSSEAVSESPEDCYSVGEITKAINSLGDDYRRPISMHVAGYSYDEISKEMSLPVGTVKSRIYYARQRLQRQFAAYRV